MKSVPRSFLGSLLLVVGALVLTGCCTTPPAGPVVTVKVPVPVPCNIVAPEVPYWPLQGSDKTDLDVFENTKKALAEIELRKGYEAKLEASIKECNDGPSN